MPVSSSKLSNVDFTYFINSHVTNYDSYGGEGPLVIKVIKGVLRSTKSRLYKSRKTNKRNKRRSTQHKKSTI